MKFFLLILLPCCIFAKQLINNVEYNLNYTPWYVGSLLSLSGQNVPKGSVQIQPYLFVTTRYGQYNEHFSFRSTPNEVIVVPQFILYYGFTQHWDMQLILQTFSRFKGSKSSTRFADSSLLFGFQLLKETQKLPFVRFTVNEIFPTGKHDKLTASQNETDLSGQGSFMTQLGLNAQKLYDWLPSYPIRFRINFNVGIPSRTTIKGLNFLGGAKNTKGTVHPGISYYLLFSPEISLTQNWVITTDIVYEHSQKDSFKGDAGTINGKPAILNLEKQDSFQLAPAIEYNFTPNLGIIFGAWFSIIGRNEEAFASGVISFNGNF